MKLLRICAALALVCAIAAPVFAQTSAPAPAPTVTSVTVPPQSAPPAAPAAVPGTTTITVPPSASPTAVVIPAPTATETPAWLNTIATIGIAITMGLVGWGIAVINSKTGLDKNVGALQLEAHARDALQSMLESLAGRAIVELGPKINSVVLNIQNPTIRAIAQAAPGLAGDAIKFFGLSPDTVAQKIIDKIGVLTASNPNANPSSSQPATPAA